VRLLLLGFAALRRAAPLAAIGIRGRTGIILRFIFLTFHKFKYVEMFHYSIREKAVDRRRFIIKHLKESREFSEDQQFHMPLRDMQQANGASGGLGGGVNHDENAETGAVNERNFLEIEDYLCPAGREQLLDVVLKFGSVFAEDQPAMKPQQRNGVGLLHANLKRHAVARV
jgi:hypothetical protein